MHLRTFKKGIFMLSDSNAQGLLGLAVAIFVIVVLFLILREFFCWYFKINERVRLQERQVNLLILLLKESKEANTDISDDAFKAEIET
jgi:hypothetical protein